MKHFIYNYERNSPVECLQFHLEDKNIAYKVSLHVISNCKDHSSYDKRCDEYGSESFKEVTPVCYESKVYRNIYCAICNGMEQSMVKGFQPNIYCKNKHRQSLAVLDQKGYSAFETYNIENCEIRFNVR